MTSSSSASVNQVPIAAAPVTWNNNDLEDWRPRIPFPAILDRIAEAGYTATEYDGSFGTDPATVSTEAAMRDLRFCGSYQWLNLQTSGDVLAETPGLISTLELLQAIDCNHLVVADALRPERVAIAGAVPGDGSASLDRAGFAKIASNAHLVAATAADYGIRVHYHNHVGTYVETPDEVEALIRELDLAAVDLCFDTGHFAFGGGDSLRFTEAHLDAIGYVHLKDVNATVLAEAKTNAWSFLDSLRHYVFADIGTGIARTDQILALLVERPSIPWIVIEQDTCQDDSTMTAARNLKAVRRMIDSKIAR